MAQWQEDIAAQQATLTRLQATLGRMEDAEQELARLREATKGELTSLRNRVTNAEGNLQAERETRRRELIRAAETASAELNTLRLRAATAESSLRTEKESSRQAADRAALDRRKTAEAMEQVRKAEDALRTEREVSRRLEDKAARDQQSAASTQLTLQHNLETASAPLNAEIAQLKVTAAAARDQYTKSFDVVRQQLVQARDALREEREQRAQEAEREQVSSTSRTNILQTQLAAAQAATRAEHEMNGRLEARAAQLRTAAEEEIGNLRRQLKTAADTREAEQRRVNSRALDDRQAITDANTRASALESQLTILRAETEKAKASMHAMSGRLTAKTGELAAEKTERLKDRKVFEQAKQALERQLAAKEELRLAGERRLVALSRKP